jgi:hypothetical protein
MSHRLLQMPARESTFRFKVLSHSNETAHDHPPFDADLYNVRIEIPIIVDT